MRLDRVVGWQSGWAYSGRDLGIGRQWEKEG